MKIAEAVFYGEYALCVVPQRETTLRKLHLATTTAPGALRSSGGRPRLSLGAGALSTMRARTPVSSRPVPYNA